MKSEPSPEMIAALATMEPVAWARNNWEAFTSSEYTAELWRECEHRVTPLYALKGARMSLPREKIETIRAWLDRRAMLDTEMNALCDMALQALAPGEQAEPQLQRFYSALADSQVDDETVRAAAHQALQQMVDETPSVEQAEATPLQEWVEVDGVRYLTQQEVAWHLKALQARLETAMRERDEAVRRRDELAQSDWRERAEVAESRLEAAEETTRIANAYYLNRAEAAEQKLEAAERIVERAVNDRLETERENEVLREQNAAMNSTIAAAESSRAEAVRQRAKLHALLRMIRKKLTDGDIYAYAHYVEWIDAALKEAQS